MMDETRKDGTREEKEELQERVEAGAHPGPSGSGTGSVKDEAEDPREKRRRELHRMTKKELEEAYLDLEERVGEAQAKAREYLEDAQRQKAELDNYRKRMIREQTRIVEQANRHLIAGLLPVIDNLEKALEACPDREDSLAVGVRMVYQQLMDILKKEGLEEINPHGHPFDPAECEAVMTVVSDDHEDETVVEVHQKGYRYKGSLLRPARATVSKCK
ncbi:nucleotide exchange factor GrpE [Candidatus Solincola tengchongensis]|uniref:nucleotide exchange factor GrpE n=1 Tax=Candidatus Solincola tengchongensis TaxID=2900693 RepID=UPI00257D49E9|nr:nucleotide exchange factor GrpE [Candidatus Solincola tengchongensis]